MKYIMFLLLIVVFGCTCPSKPKYSIDTIVKAKSVSGSLQFYRCQNEGLITGTYSEMYGPAYFVKFRCQDGVKTFQMKETDIERWN